MSKIKVFNFYKKKMELFPFNYPILFSFLMFFDISCPSLLIFDIIEIPSISDHQFKVSIIINASANVIVIFNKFVEGHIFVSKFAVSSLRNTKLIIFFFNFYLLPNLHDALQKCPKIHPKSLPRFFCLPKHQDGFWLNTHL